MLVKPIPLVPISGMGETKYMKKLKEDLLRAEQEKRELEQEIRAIKKAMQDAKKTWKSIESEKKGGRTYKRKK